MDTRLFEKRSPKRMPDPDCPTCKLPDPMVTVRTAFVVYYRCGQCGEVWNVTKPGAMGEPA
jgi:hypothetical protein